MAQQKRIRLGTMKFWVRSLALLSGLRIWHCRELWCRLQTRLGSGVAVAWCRLAAVAPIRPLGWEPPYAMGVALKRQKDKQTKKVQGWEFEFLLWFSITNQTNQYP